MKVRFYFGTRTLAVITAAAIAVTTAAWAQPNDESYTSPVQPGDLQVQTDPFINESPMGRLEWMKEQMGGELSGEFRDALLEAGQSLKNGGFGAAAGGSWVSLGPTDTTRFQNSVNKAEHDTGRMRVVLPDPRASHADTVYLLTSGGGLWKTSNFSANKPDWEAKTDNLFATSGGGAAFGRTPEVLYLGSGDPFRLGIGGIMYKSTDGADSWGPAFALPANPYGAAPQRILDVKVDTSVGTTDATDIVMVGTDAGLYRSADGGATYSYVAVFAPLEAFFAGIGGGHEDWSFARTSAGWLVSQAYWQVCSNCFEQTVVYVSGDAGATWTAIPDAEGDLNSGVEGRTTLSVGLPGDSDVYALSANNNGSAQLDVFRSADGGLNWTPLGANSGLAPTNPNVWNPNMNIMAGQAWYNQLLQVDPTDPTRDTAWIGGQLGSAVTRDGGSSWTLLTSWLGRLPANFFGPGTVVDLPYLHADCHTAAISTASGEKRVFFGHDGGVGYSDDDGKSWKDNANQGVVTSLIYALVSGTKHPEQTLIGLQDNGTRFRVGQSTTWTGSIGGDGFGVGWSQANDEVSIGTVFFLNILRWTKNPPNNQAKFDALLSTSNLAGPANAWLNDSYFVTPIATPSAAADPTGLVFYTNTRNFVLKTENGGDFWEAIWTSPGGRVVRSVSHGVGLSHNDLDVIGLAGSGGHFVYTDDGGTSWTDVDVAASLATWVGFNSSVAWASDNTTVYLASQSPLPASIGVGPYVARSTDGGNTWADATGNMPKVPVQKLYTDPTDANGNTVYAATWIGVFVTQDGGATWAPLGAGLPLALVTDMYFPPDGSFVRVSTFGRGVWELALDD